MDEYRDIVSLECKGMGKTNYRKGMSLLSPHPLYNAVVVVLRVRRPTACGQGGARRRYLASKTSVKIDMGRIQLRVTNCIAIIQCSPMYQGLKAWLFLFDFLGCCVAVAPSWRNLMVGIRPKVHRI